MSSRTLHRTASATVIAFLAAALAAAPAGGDVQTRGSHSPASNAAIAPGPTTPSFVFWTPVNREQPGGQWNSEQFSPRVGDKCTVSEDGSETYCGGFPGYFFGPTTQTIGLKVTGDATLAVSVYRSNTRAGVVVLYPGDERCFDRTSLTSTYKIDAQSLSRDRGGVLEVTRVTKSGGGCGTRGLNMAFNPYRHDDPQWGKNNANPHVGSICSSEVAPVNGRDINCGQLNSGNLGLSTGGIILRNDSTLGRGSVRVVAYAPPQDNFLYNDPGSAIGSYVLAPGQEHCFGFRGAGTGRHTITLQRPPGTIGTKVSVVGISTSGSSCRDDGLNMVRGYSS